MKQYNINNASGQVDGRMDGWLGFNGILSTQVAAIVCFKGRKGQRH